METISYSESLRLCLANDFFELPSNKCTEKREEKLQTSVPCLCYCFLVEYLALAGLMNFLAQLSDKIHHFTVYNLMPLAFLTKLSKMH